MSNGNTIIAFFSRRGENLNVGSVEKGSGEIIASMLSSMMGAPGYQIRTENGYPDDLAECNRIAKKELGSGARYTEIVHLNGLKTNVIYSGQKLKLPEK